MTADLLAAGEWWPGDLAARLGASIDTIRGWIRREWVHARKIATASGT